ncbi:hypothetical protein FB451DRAFT_1364329 [Mycena latifolia]|nr:hypothetical protein FB451DRAFT_1364329 [Mycena latifolia]
MRKKDYRAHNPILKWSTSSTIGHRDQYRPFLSLFIGVVATLFAFLTSTFITEPFKLVVKLVALDHAVDPSTVVAALIVYFTELCALFFCIVHRRNPVLHRILNPPRRYHRTHISHLRLDRVTKYGLAFKVFDERSSHKNPPPLPHHHHPKTKPREDAVPARVQSLSNQCIVEGDTDEEDSGDGDSENSEDSDGHHEQRISEPPPLSRKTRRLFCHPRVPVYTGGGEGTATGTEAPVEDITSSDDSECPPPPDFNLSDWIGTGRLWADDVPQPVKRARNLARRFPPEAFAAVAIPSSSLVVTDLLQEQIPDPSTHTGHAAFSREPVTPAPFDATWRESLFTATKFLPDLRGFFNNAWLSGAASIKFPHLSAYYPLWIEHLLFDVQVYAKKRARWVQASEWLTRQSHDLPSLAELAQDCFDTFDALPWDTVVPGLSPAFRLAE